MEVENPWYPAFVVVDADGNEMADQGIALTQRTERAFEIGQTIRYNGPTGLDGADDTLVRTLDVRRKRSDLASVPAIMRWFVSPHGLHTPAALFHDQLIEPGSELDPVSADRAFRAMLGALGVATVRRSIMWTGVALRTRWSFNKLIVALWVALSATGLTLFVLALVGVDLPGVLGNRGGVLIVTALAPLPASLLWGRQFGAALVAAVVAIWVVPAGAITLSALGIYWVLERSIRALWG